jgi:hypothetical protein
MYVNTNNPNPNPLKPKIPKLDEIPPKIPYPTSKSPKHNIFMFHRYKTKTTINKNLISIKIKIIQYTY